VTTAWEDRAGFCLVCGTQLVARTLFGSRRLACSACDFVFFRATSTAAVAVVIHGREVLLVRRAIPPGRGQWCFPGGFQEYGETPAETARREAREEAGVEVEVGRVLDVVLSTENPEKLVNLVAFLARPVEPVGVVERLRAADDVLEARFFPIDVLPEDIAFANNRTILARLREQFPTGDIQ
jgi:ADP-ribose pyrophosphatase YjhB (NUDIX family)